MRLVSRHGHMYSIKCWAEKLGCRRLMSRIQLLASRAWCSVLFFLLKMEKRCGATSQGRCPFSHALFQNYALSPSPIVSLVDAAKRSLSTLLQGVSSPSYGLSVLVDQPRHNHRNLRALANFPRWRMPKPPEYLGLADRGQFTLHFPPVIASAPARRNFFLCRSMSLSVSFGARNEVRKYTACKVRTALTKVKRLAGLIWCPFQRVSLLIALSTNGWKSTRFRRLTVNGNHDIWWGSVRPP
jgi:hypothetical protein